MNLFRRLFIVSLVVLSFVVFQSPSSANHKWNRYHWGRTSNPFTVKLGNNLSSGWSGHLSTASSDWTASSVMNTTVVAGSTNSTCKATLGRVEVCNGAYGSTGWLGVASIWVADNRGHISQGTVKVNDSYSMNAAEKLHVMCQEVGHTFGLGHQSTSGASLNTCMDYYANTSDSDTKSTHPNQHDYDQLESIYGHLDSTTTVKRPNTPPAFYGIDLSGPGQWGKLIEKSPDGRYGVYMLDFGNGFKVFTFVIWAEGSRAGEIAVDRVQQQ